MLQLLLLLLLGVRVKQLNKLNTEILLNGIPGAAPMATLTTAIKSANDKATKKTKKL